MLVHRALGNWSWSLMMDIARRRKSYTPHGNPSTSFGYVTLCHSQSSSKRRL